jgi:6-phospho-3-hexuloisomerase
MPDSGMPQSGRQPATPAPEAQWDERSVAALQTVAEELTTRLAAISREQWEPLVEMLRNASANVLVSGQGRSGLVAQMAAMRFMHLGLRAHFVGEATSPPVRAGDVLVVVSGSGATPVSVEFARIAHREGASVTVITKDAASALATIADVAVILGTGESAQFAGSAFEQAALALLDAVVLDLRADDRAAAYDDMQLRHTNLQ